MSALPLAFRPRQHGSFAPRGGRIAGKTEMARLIRGRDWSTTFLGALDTWSETLVGVVNMLLASPIPSTLYWGPRLVILYNDAYLPVVGSRHPAALGGSGPEVWKEVWPLLEPQFERIFEAGEATRQDGVMIPIEVDGKLQDFYWNYTLSGLYEDGEIAGVYNTATDVTAAALTAMERDSLADRLNQTLEATSDGVVAIDRNWTFSYMNQAARTANQPIVDMVGRNLWETLPRLLDESCPDRHFFKRAMEHSEPGEFESFYAEPLNHWLHMQVRPAPDGIVLFFRDVTEERRSAAALAASEEELRWTIKLSMQIPWTASPDGSILTLGDTWLELTGLTREEGLGSGWVHCQHPDDLPMMASGWSHSLATATPYDFEHRIRAASGEFHWMRTRAFPRFDEAGRVLKWYGTTEDIEARKQAEEALRTTEQLAAAALAASEEELRWSVKLNSQIPWTASPEGAITSFSDRWLEFTGLSREVLLGDGWANAIHPDDLERAQAAWARSVGSGEPLDVEHRFWAASGEYRWLRGQATARRDERGTIVKWYGTLEDIEDRKRSEDALRTAEKLAAVGRLASSIAHEINNPLESVTNLLYLARGSENLPAEVEDYLDSAERELRRASVITNQTLRFHRQSTNPTATDTAELIESGLSVYQGRLLNSHVAVERRLRATKPILCFDGELRQVFNNLVANAIDAMHPGGGRLLLRTREATHPATGRPGLVLTVADTGPGMSAEVRKKIFEPFFTTKGIGGTGLGLWVTQEIVLRHHGTLRLRSSREAAHRGTVFTLFLPFHPGG